MPYDHKNVHEHHFFSQLIDFIHSAKLNKTTTTSLLSLLRTSKSFTTDIPKTTNALWQKLGVKFAFKIFYFCSLCFKELNHYQDACPTCHSNEKANSELCAFSLAEEIERVVKSTIDIIKWYSVPENQLVADVIQGKLHTNIVSKEYKIEIISFR